jgi:hypothetical protein
MENKRVEIIKEQEVMLYTKVELFEDILAASEECVKNTSEGEKARRDYRNKLKVLQSIFDMKLPLYDFE